ncbi:thioredoxin family protein [Chitinimonas sp. BJB300]|uniref:thioredoxin family protein n=1 Tax=Chitinimonas sp. BJB300 TaxID=1559339 RepID=UPI000C0F5D6A|nr:thioredoxin family protein [Chitinimonas sp. BJB300]PHV10717.1 disulfide isomerase [Chitinimonas sp. BJB300]TSJ88539.1 thioredoxin family protein [Chitinimonas sp. BJB300]
MKPFILAAVLLAASPALANTDSPASGHDTGGIAWQRGDVDAAFAQAKSSNKPLFLYWGANWCPPCNQVKATIFNRQEFIERSRAFIPVYIDGDSPGAQKLGTQFKVRGYPTMILFKPDGTELTRLPGEVDADRYLQTLTLGLSAARPVKATLASALRNDKPLSADEWRLLADYAWETDEAQLVADDKLVDTLRKLAGLVPADQVDVAVRLQLKALAAAASGEKVVGFDKAGGLAIVRQVLVEPRLARDNFDVVVNYAGEVVSLLTDAKSPDRLTLVAAWNKALQKLVFDDSLSTADRLGAVAAQVALAKAVADADHLPPALLQQVRERISEADKSTTNGYERQSVISTAAHALSEAGLIGESDALLQAELKRSHSPYYFMLSLASNAKKRGDKAGALNWYEQAYAKSEGPATRLQWGGTYVAALVELSPQDEARISQATQAVFSEVADTQNAFYERNRRSLEKIVAKLAEWNKTKQHDVVVKKALGQLGSICTKLPASDAQKPICQGLVKPA